MIEIFFAVHFFWLTNLDYKKHDSGRAMCEESKSWPYNIFFRVRVYGDLLKSDDETIREKFDAGAIVGASDGWMDGEGAIRLELDRVFCKKKAMPQQWIIETSEEESHSVIRETSWCLRAKRAKLEAEIKTFCPPPDGNWVNNDEDYFCSLKKENLDAAGKKIYDFACREKP